MENNIKLICLDLDGTLLDPNGEISGEDQEAIREITRQGVEVMISTGRPYVGIPDPERFAALGIRYALTVNGAAIYTIPDRKLIQEQCLDTEGLPKIFEEIQKKNVYFDFFVGGGGYGYGAKKDLIRKIALLESQKEYILRTRTFVENPAEFLRSHDIAVQKVTVDFIEDEKKELIDFEDVAKILNRDSRYTVVSGGCNNLEFTEKGVSKGVALESFAKSLGITLDEVMAIGDSENDLEIIKMAKYGVAMENAQDCVKKEAFFITRSNLESGVAYAIRTLCAKA